MRVSILHLPDKSSTFDILHAAGYMPSYYFDAVYKGIEGRKNLGSGIYSVPCDTKLNVSMVFK